MTDEMSALEKAQTDYALLTDDYEELAHDVMRLRAERDALTAECNEQARLNGMGAERELALMAKVNTLVAELADAKADHLRRHNDAVDRYEEIIVLKARVQALKAENAKLYDHLTICMAYITANAI